MGVGQIGCCSCAGYQVPLGWVWGRILGATVWADLARVYCAVVGDDDARNAVAHGI